MNFGIGLSAIRASQYAIDSVSQNVANASTEGYHRQQVIFQSTYATETSGRFSGNGVEIGEIRRFRDLISESAFTNTTSDLSRVDQSLQIESQLELLFTPGVGSIQDALGGLFDDLSRLSANPGESTLRDSVLSEAGNLANRLQEASGQIVNMRENVNQQLQLEVASLNLEIEELVEIQNRITADVSGTSTNDLLDRRDQLVNIIAERIDVQRFEQVRGQLGLSMAGSSVSVGTVAFRFEAVTDESGAIQIQLENGNQPVNISGGRIAGLVDASNDLLETFSGRLDEFAGQLIQNFNDLHASGIGTNGSFDILYGESSVTDVDLPLSESAAFDIQAGELFVSVTSPTGERRTTGISISPESDSLADVAASISGIDNIQALVDSATGKLSIVAVPGYEFDFTGRLDTTPDLGNFTGTSTPVVAGNYTGTSNETYTVTAVSGGVVGRTSDLTLQIANSNGDTISEINVGDGYVAGSPISIGQGVTIALEVGEVVSGDSFEITQVAQADSTGFLAAVGLNNFFNGTNASDIELSTRLRQSPASLATSLTGDVSDTQNLEGLINLRDSSVLSNGTASFESFMETINSELGFRVQTSTSVQVSLTDLQFEYRVNRESTSGVDVNEELINLTSYQNNYEAALQVVRTMESMLDELFSILR